jgi:phage tail-like protein
VTATVELRRGLTHGQELWGWHGLVSSEDPLLAKDAQVVLFAADGEQVARFSLVGAWPEKLAVEGPTSDGDTVSES